MAPKLSSSTLLLELTQASHTDFVGKPSTAASLGLAESYTILLLSSCAHFSGGSVSCSQPSLRFAFDPRSDLRLDSTALQGTYPEEFLSALNHYHNVARSMAASYVAVALFTALAPLAALFAHRSRAAGIIAATLGCLSTILLLAASIAGIIAAKDLSSHFNAALGESGLSSKVGSLPTALSFVATILAIATAAIFIKRARSPAGGGAAAYATGRGTGSTGKGKNGGLLSRIPGLGQHRYVPVEKQLLARAAAPGHQDDVVFDSSTAAGRRRLEEDWAAEDEYSAGSQAIPMKALGGAGRQRDMDTAYEPYSHNQG